MSDEPRKTNDDLRLALAECPPPGALYRHGKSGNLYRVIGRCLWEATAEPAVLYERFPGDGLIWCRPLSEWRQKYHGELLGRHQQSASDRLNGSEQVLVAPDGPYTTRLQESQVMSDQPTPAHPFFQPLTDDPGTAYLLWCLSKRFSVADNSCWVWTGAKNGDGYGWIESHGKRKMVHRLIHELCVGEIPDTYLVLHNCPGGDNPSCCNPAHLWVGTERDNNRDCAAKGRHPDAVIKPEQVEEIRRRLASGGRGIVKQLAKEYGVTTGAIVHIRKGRSWGHIQ